MSKLHLLGKKTNQSLKVLSWVFLRTLFILTFLMTPIITLAQETAAGYILNTGAGAVARVFYSYVFNNPGEVLASGAKTMLGGIDGLIGWFLGLFVWLASYILYFTGQLFNQIIKVSIVEFAEIAKMDFIQNSWELVRDLANIGFIFLLLYIAISTILRLSSANTTKLLTMVIIAALLINFSAFFTRTAIDVSNTVAIVFYNNMDKNRQQGKTPDLSMAFFSPSQGVLTYGEEPEEDFDPIQKNASAILKQLGAFSAAILAIFVLMGAALLFLIRTIVLLILIITSPLAFLGLALSITGKNITGMWTKALIAQLLFAPVFMGMFFISLKMIESRDLIIGNLQSGSDYANIGQIIFFLMTIGLMLSSIIIASLVGAHGGKRAEKFVIGKSQQTLGMARNIGLGAAAGAFTHTASRGAAKIAGGKWAQRMEAKRPAIGGVIRRTAEKAGSSYATKVDAQTKRSQQRMRSLDPEFRAQYASNLPTGFWGMTQNQQQNLYKEMSDSERAKMETDAQEKINEAEARTAASGGVISPADAQIIKQNEELLKSLQGLRGNLDPEKKESTEKVLAERLKQIYNKLPEDQKVDQFVRLDPADQKLLFNALGAEGRAEIDELIKDKITPGTSGTTWHNASDTIDEATKELDATEKDKTKKATRERTAKKERNKAMDQIDTEVAALPTIGWTGGSTPHTIKTEFDKLKTKDVLDLYDRNPSILTNPAIMNLLTGGHLAQLSQSGQLDAATKTTIRTYITGAAGRAHADATAKKYLMGPGGNSF